MGSSPQRKRGARDAGEAIKKAGVLPVSPRGMGTELPPAAGSDSINSVPGPWYPQLLDHPPLGESYIGVTAGR